MSTRRLIGKTSRPDKSCAARHRYSPGGAVSARRIADSVFAPPSWIKRAASLYCPATPRVPLPRSTYSTACLRRGSRCAMGKGGPSRAWPRSSRALAATAIFSPGNRPHNWCNGSWTRQRFNRSTFNVKCAERTRYRPESPHRIANRRHSSFDTSRASCPPPYRVPHRWCIERPLQAADRAVRPPRPVPLLPVSCRNMSGILDVDRVGEDVAILFGHGLILDIKRLDQYFNFIRRVFIHVRYHVICVGSRGGYSGQQKV